MDMIAACRSHFAPEVEKYTGMHGRPPEIAILTGRDVVVSLEDRGKQVSLHRYRVTADGQGWHFMKA